MTNATTAAKTTGVATTANSRALKSWQVVRIVAGVFILLSLALGLWLHPYWFGFTAFVGLNLLQSGFTRWCLMEKILQKLGVEAGC